MKEILKDLIDHIETCLEELKGAPNTEFICGERTAYAECLEVIQKWKKSQTIGLNYDIEKKFPL